MSSAFYPQGMSTYNNRLPQGGYKTWKGDGPLSNPVGITATNIRPLTNNDTGNIFPTGFGLPRPIKHFRKGTVIPTTLLDPTNTEASLINYNLNRAVRSSTGASLGGGHGGRGLLTQVIDSPGSFIMKQNPINETNETNQLNLDCQTCNGIGIVSDYYPNTTYLTENPEPNTTNPPLCCNAQKKALRRVIPASTKLKKNYYTTLQQYRQNRCQTYQQRVFNFKSAVDTGLEAAIIENYSGSPFITAQVIKNAKPGSALALLNTYVANCQPNAELEDASEINLVSLILKIMEDRGIITQSQIENLKIDTFRKLLDFISSLENPTRESAIEIYNDFVNNPYFGLPLTGPSNLNACKLVVYKPNNPQFATQGAVSSSTRILKLNVNTIQTNLAGYNRDQINGVATLETNKGGNPSVPFLFKNKYPKCQAQTLIHFQNKKSCSLTKDYSLNTKPYQPAFNSNHFKQSPRNPLM